MYSLRNRMHDSLAPYIKDSDKEALSATLQVRGPAVWVGCGCGDEGRRARLGLPPYAGHAGLDVGRGKAGSVLGVEC